MSFTRSIRFLALAAAFAAAACSDTNDGPLTKSVAAVEVIPGNRSMQVGETYTFQGRVLDNDGDILGGRTVTWVSSNPAVATVTFDGIVKAIAPGVAVIAATADTKIGTSQLTVTPGPVTNVPVASVMVSPTAIVLQTAQTRQLTAFLRDAKGNALTGRIVNWSSDEPSVATVSSTGLITGVSPGYATIVAASEGVTFGVGLTVVEDQIPFDLIYHRTASNGDQQILTLNLALGTPPIVLNAGTVSREPSPSPTGDRYAFAVSMVDIGTAKRVDDIFAVNRNGVNMKQLTNAVGTEDHPAWSPIGNRIAYRHIEVQGTRTDIWAMNTDGSAQTNLTADMSPGWTVGAPAWSADGQRITFAAASLTGVAGTTHGIWVMDADGGNKEMLTNTLTGFDASPTWSPDGTRIAFIRFYAGDADISFVGSAGGAVSRVEIDGNQAAPAWSPDGAVIAYAQQVSGRNLVYTVKPNGTDVRLRTSPIFGGGTEPAWITR